MQTALNAMAIPKRTRDAAEGFTFFFVTFFVLESYTLAVAGATRYALKINTKENVINIIRSQLPVAASPPVCMSNTYMTEIWKQMYRKNSASFKRRFTGKSVYSGYQFYKDE